MSCKPIRMLSAFVTVAWSIGAISESTAASPKVGDHVRIAATAACPTAEDITKLNKLLEQKDLIGAQAYIADRCLDLPAGLEFIVDSIEAGAFCGRPPGSRDCLWMSEAAILEPNVNEHRLD